MSRLIKVCNFYSLMGIWCTQEFYKKLADKGFVLKKTMFFYDVFEKSLGSEKDFTLIPRELEQADKDDTDEKGWEYLGRNRNFYVYVSDVDKKSPPLFVNFQWTAEWLWKPACVVAYPFIFLNVLTNPFILRPGLALITMIIIYMGYLYSFFLELFELLYLNKYNQVKKHGKYMLIVSLILTILSHLSLLVLTILILSSFFI